MSERTMGEIEELTRTFSEAREVLRDELDALERAVADLRRGRLPRIRELVSRAADAHASLSAAIEDSPALFERPRTRVMHGIKVGFRKQPGQVEFTDARQVVRLIRAHLPDRADSLIKVTETPVKSALAKLSVAELRRIGASLAETGDEVFIRPADSEIDRLVDALLADDEAPERQVA